MPKFYFKSNIDQILAFIDEMSHKKINIAQIVIHDEKISIVKIYESNNSNDIKLQIQDPEIHNEKDEESAGHSGDSMQKRMKQKRSELDNGIDNSKRVKHDEDADVSEDECDIETD